MSLAGFFPIAPSIATAVELNDEKINRLQSLYWYLPPADEAADLRHIYFHHAGECIRHSCIPPFVLTSHIDRQLGCRSVLVEWLSVCLIVSHRYNIVSLDQFNENIYYQFYNPNGPILEDPLLSHQLAVMFMVLSIGSLMDTKRPSYNIDAEKYHQLARAALFQSPIFEEPTIHAVQVLVSQTHEVLLRLRSRPVIQYLMAFYLFLAERHGSGVGSRWALMGLAVRLGISVRIHSSAHSVRLID